jgi:hypothetical protein
MGLSVKTHIVIRRTCGADNKVADIKSSCFNCGNIIDINDLDQHEDLRLMQARHGQKVVTGRDILAKAFIYSCSLPYIIVFIGYLVYKDASGEKSSYIFLYLFIAFAMVAFNTVAGIPLLLVKYSNKTTKPIVALSYLIGGILPFLFGLYSSLSRKH